MTAAQRRKLLNKSLSVASSSPVTESSFITLTAEKDYSGLIPKSVGTERIVQSVDVPETRLLTSEILFSADHSPNVNLLRSHLTREGRLDIQAALQLVQTARKIIAAEPNVLEIQTPVTICGDLHGQFFDLLSILNNVKPGQGTRILFLGDYVDRGYFSTEILFLLLAYKIKSPHDIWLIRGNHETRMMAEYMTFALECEFKYASEALYQEFIVLFNSLPLCAVVKGNASGDFFAVHGGLSPSISTLDDIRTLNRFVEPPTEGPLCDLLWADPLEEQSPDVDMRTWYETAFIENFPRQTSFIYGPAAVSRFLRTNNLVSVVRAHQVMEGGFKEHFFLDHHEVAPVITLFSCPNYCDMYRNKGAIMNLTPEGYDFYQFCESPHPFYLPDFADPFTYGLPFLMENMVSVLSELVIAIKEESPESIPTQEKELDAALADKMKKLQHALNVKEQREAKLQRLKKQMLFTEHSNLSLFERARMIDISNEQAPTKSKTVKRKPPLMRTGSTNSIATLKF